MTTPDAVLTSNGEAETAHDSNTNEVNIDSSSRYSNDIEEDTDRPPSPALSADQKRFQKQLRSSIRRDRREERLFQLEIRNQRMEEILHTVSERTNRLQGALDALISYVSSVMEPLGSIAELLQLKIVAKSGVRSWRLGVTIDSWYAGSK